MSWHRTSTCGSGTTPCWTSSVRTRAPWRSGGLRSLDQRVRRRRWFRLPRAARAGQLLLRQAANGQGPRGGRGSSCSTATSSAPSPGIPPLSRVCATATGRSQQTRRTSHRRPDEFLVVDADSSQSYAINSIVAGHDLVIEGPPGTGKSQTIANLIATLSARGKRVLFVPRSALPSTPCSTACAMSAWPTGARHA